MIDINLLPSKTLLSARAQRWEKNIFLAAFILTTVVVVSGAVLFGLERWALSRISILEQQRQESLTRFNNEIPKLEMLLSLKDKIAGIKRVQTIRPNLSVAISRQQGLLVDGVATTRMTVSSDGNMSFDVTIRDVKALSDYLTKLDSDEARDFFKAVTISGLQMGKDNGFAFSVAAQFDKDKLLTGSKNL